MHQGSIARYCAIENLKRSRPNQSPGECDGESLKPGRKRRLDRYKYTGRMLMSLESDWS